LNQKVDKKIEMDEEVHPFDHNYKLKNYFLGLLNT